MGRGPHKTDMEKRLEGVRGKLVKLETPVRQKAPQMPSSLDDMAKKCWKELGPKLERMGLLTELDKGSFANLCRCYSHILTCEKALAEHPSLMQVVQKPLPDGNTTTELKPSPYLVQQRLLFAEWRQYAAMFGLSPRGRAGLTLKSKKDEGTDLLS